MQPMEAEMEGKDTRPTVELLDSVEAGSKITMTVRFTFDKDAPMDETRKTLENMSVSDLLGKIVDDTLKIMKGMGPLDIMKEKGR